MSADDIRHFLVVYDIRAGEAEVHEFEDYEEAVARYEELEQRFFGSNDYDIVLLGADSLETIRRTHSSYFETTQHGFERFFQEALTS